VRAALTANGPYVLMPFDVRGHRSYTGGSNLSPLKWPSLERRIMLGADHDEG